MLYRLNAALTADAAVCVTELDRFVRHAKTLIVRHITVAPPYRSVRQTHCLIEVPDRYAAQIERVLTILTGEGDALVRISGFKNRAEWMVRTLVVPRAGAEPLDGRLLAAAHSVHLQVRYTPRGSRAELMCALDDQDVLGSLVAAQWRAVGTPTRWRRWRARRTPLVAPSLGAGEPRAAAPSLPTPAAPSAPASVGWPLDASGAPMLHVGVTTDGAAWGVPLHALRVLSAGNAAQQAALLPLLAQRALAAGMGVLAIVPRAVADAISVAVARDRLRVLDSANLWQSAAIRWDDLPVAELTAVLGSVGITLPIPTPLPTPFGALLQAVGASDLALPGVLGLTAPPGDDLRGVLAAGGGVVLIDDDPAVTPLLGGLLQAHCAHPQPPPRPLLLLLPTRLPVQTTLAAGALHVAYGSSAAEQPAAAHLTLRLASAGWVVTAPFGATITLLPDLTTPPPAQAATQYGVVEADNSLSIEKLPSSDNVQVEQEGSWLEDQAIMHPSAHKDKPNTAVLHSVLIPANDPDVSGSIPTEQIQDTVVESPFTMNTDRSANPCDPSGDLHPFEFRATAMSDVGVFSTRRDPDQFGERFAEVVDAPQVCGVDGESTISTMSVWRNSRTATPVTFLEELAPAIVATHRRPRPRFTPSRRVQKQADQPVADDALTTALAQDTEALLQDASGALLRHYVAPPSEGIDVQLADLTAPFPPMDVIIPSATPLSTPVQVVATTPATARTQTRVAWDADRAVVDWQQGTPISEIIRRYQTLHPTTDPGQVRQVVRALLHTADTHTTVSAEPPLAVSATMSTVVATARAETTASVTAITSPPSLGTR